MPNGRMPHTSDTSMLLLQLLEVFRLHVATTCFQETFLGDET
jgi:hypothetical protein